MEDQGKYVTEKDKKIDDIEKKIAQLKAQKQALIQREKEKERKARTKRLIEMGAVLESNLLLSTPKEVKLLCDYITKYPASYDKIKAYIKKHMDAPEGTVVEDQPEE